MPSKKPKIVAYTDQKTLDKITKIAKKNVRSLSQEIVYLVKKEVENYEKEHGEIILEEEND